MTHANPYAPDKSPLLLCGNCGAPQREHGEDRACPMPPAGTFRAIDPPIFRIERAH